MCSPPSPPPLSSYIGVFALLALAAVGAVSGTEASSGGTRGPHHPRGQVAHTHYRPHRPPAPPSTAPTPAPKLTGDEKLLHDAEHIREDLGEWVTREDTSRMSPEELEFHYFQIHDVDNNTKLDGLEMLQAILHTSPHAHADDGDGEGGGEGPPHEQAEDDLEGVTAGSALRQEQTVSLQDDFSYFVELIDRVLLEDDVDRDGYLSYVEYVMGRQRDDQQQQRQNQHQRQQRQAASSTGHEGARDI